MKSRYGPGHQNHAAGGAGHWGGARELPELQHRHEGRTCVRTTLKVVFFKQTEIDFNNYHKKTIQVAKHGVIFYFSS